MNKKAIGLLVSMLLFATVFSVVAVNGNNNEPNHIANILSGTDDWPMLYHDPQHTGFSSSDAPNANITLFPPIYCLPSSPPIVGENRLYFCSGGLFIAVYDAPGPTLVGNIAKKSNSAVAVADGKVYVAADDGFLYCYDTSNYTIDLWNVSLGTMSSLYAPIAVDGHVYQAYQDWDTGYTNITGRDATTGAPLWANDISLGPVVLNSDIVVDSGKIYFTLGQKLYCYDGSSGAKLWESANIDTFDKDIPAISNGKLFTLSVGGIVYCLDLAANGAVVWNYTTGDLAFTLKNHPSVAYGNVYVGTNKKLYCLNMTTPNPPVWVYSSSNVKPLRNPIVADGKIFVVVAQQGLKCLNAYTGAPIWKLDSFSSFCPAIANSILYYLDGSYMYIISGFVDNAPVTPATPSGPIEIYVNTTYAYTTSTTDPDPGDQIFYQFYFHGYMLDEYTEWFGPFNSGDIATLNFVFPERRWHEMQVRARDQFHLTSNWSAKLHVNIVNRAPSDPVITSPTSGVIRGDVVQFNFVSTDLDNDSVRYQVDWGDGTPVDQSNYAPSGTTVSINHTFTQVETCIIKARTQDNYGYVGNWSNWTSYPVQVQRELAIGKITGGGKLFTGGVVTAEILNFRNNTGITENILWNISVKGGVFGYINVSVNGTITNPGLTKMFTNSTQPKKIYGFGPVKINVTVQLGSDKLQKDVAGFVLFWKVLLRET